MQLFGLIGVSIYMLTCLVVGLRLLSLSVRTQGQPERLIGTAFLFGGVLGYAPTVVASALREAQPAFSSQLTIAGSVGLVTAAVCLLLFWRNVYHAGQRSARNVVRVAIALMSVCLVGLGLTLEPGQDPAATAWMLPLLLLQAGVYALNAGAATRQWRMLGRRIALGLADPVVANRMLLWGLAAFGTVLSYAYTTTQIVLTGQSSVTPMGTAVISSIGMFSAALIWLAFFPPRAYVARLKPDATPSA